MTSLQMLKYKLEKLADEYRIYFVPYARLEIMYRFLCALVSSHPL